MSKNRPCPTTPTVFPVLFALCALLVGGAYMALEWLGYPPGYALLVAPLLLPLLPAEIKYALDRRKISSNIITDFISKPQDVDTDYERILEGMRRKGLAVQTATAGEDDTQGPMSWR